VVQAWAYGPKECNSALEWADLREKRRAVRNPKVINSGRRPLTARGR
jgi:hypothetical protein